MERRLAPALFAALLAVAALAFPAPARMSHAEEGPDLPDALFFALQIADEQGEVLAEPKLLGMCGVPLEMTLADPGELDSPRMSLRLQPETQGDGSLEIAFELSLPGRFERSAGSVRVFPGEEKSARVNYPGGHIDVQLAAFAVPSAELDLYLEHGARRLEVLRRT